MNFNNDYFITIVESGSLQQAADKLFVSQPSLSQYIKRLEDKLGVRLFDRGYSPMKLTYAGEYYYSYVLQQKQMDFNIIKTLQDIKKEKIGRIRLGVALWRSACLLPDIFPYYHETHPNIKIELVEGRYTFLKKALENFEIDFMIANLLPTGKYANLEKQSIMEERILIAIPTSWKARYGLSLHENVSDFPSISLSELEHLPLVLTKKGQSLTDMVMSTFAKNKKNPYILMETGNLTTAINLTAKNICYTFVPEEGAHICKRGEDIIFCRPKNISLSWELAFLYRKGTYIDTPTREFITLTKQIVHSKRES